MRWLWYERDSYLSPTLCSSNFNIYIASFQCYSCLNGAIEVMCGSAISNANMIFYASAGFADYSVPMTILSCNPFYAESADGKIVLTE